MTTATTTLFSQSNVAALMIIDSKAPRFEITVFGEVTATFPATRSWKREQKLAVEAAQALLAAHVGAEIDAAIAALPNQPTTASRTRIAFLILVHADGSRTLEAQGGKHAAARSAALGDARDFLLSRGLAVTVGPRALTISAPADLAA